MMLRKLFNIIRNLLAVIGLCSLLAGAFGAVYIARSYQLPPREFAIKVARKLGISSPALEKALAPADRYAAVTFQGEFLTNKYPRLLFAGKSEVNSLRLRYHEDEAFRATIDSLGRSKSALGKAIGWTCSGNIRYQKEGLDYLEGVAITQPKVEGSDLGNGIELALAYDLLRSSSADISQVFEIRLQKYLQDTLIILDGDSASLWHGRTALASAGWIAASVLDGQSDATKGLIRRAQAHFLEAVLALEVTEGWPEGYNYWINNRAFPVALAALGHMNAVEAPLMNERIRQMVERVGVWTIHGSEPQGRFTLFGDTGPRNDLKDETQRFIDLVYLATGNPAFKQYSEYLSALHGREAYYHGYRWGLPLFRGWITKSEPSPLKNMLALEGQLPYSELFGRGSFGQAFIRSGWGPDSTFISFQGGHTFTHHGHYQAGHFSLFKEEPLVITSGTYGSWTSPHRLNYYMRTVASNSLLILRPNEKVQPNRFFESNVSDGGQRIVVPTGSAITSVEDWRDNLYKGDHYEGGKITAFENKDSLFTYIASDLTGAYNNTSFDDNGKGGKVSQVTRQLLYLRGEDVLVVYDRVVATDGGFVKKWLLHSFLKPQSAHEKILVGNGENGILESKDELLIIPGKVASLAVQKLLPLDGVVRKIGGPDYRYYVEVDGSEEALDGRNMVSGADEKPWFDSGMWRLEIQPEVGRKADNFLVLLKPGSVGMAPGRLGRLLVATGGEGVETSDSVAFFAINADALSCTYQVTAGQRRHLLLGLAPKREFQVSSGGQRFTVRSSAEGVVVFELDMAQAGEVQVRSL